MFLKMHKKDGSLLLEALLSVAIISIALGVIIQSLYNSYRFSVNNARYILAINLAENLLSEIMLRSPDELNVQPEQGQFDSPNELYFYEIQAGQAAESKGLQKISARVYWKAGQKDSDVELSTYVFFKESNEI